MATHQMTRAFGSLSVSGSRPSNTGAPGFGFCACMRGQSILGAVAGGPALLGKSVLPCHGQHLASLFCPGL